MIKRLSLVGLVIILALSTQWGIERIRVNLAALDAMHATFTGGRFLPQFAQRTNFQQECSLYWFASFIAQSNNEIAARDEAYQKAIACHPGYVKFLHFKYPEDLKMAELSLQTQPASAESWFWAGDLIPEKKIEYYEQGLKIDPTDGRRWIVLGDLINQTDPQSAIQAYLQGCFNGDPGYNGCVRAGSVAERLGLYDDAIRYYRLSSYPPYRNKANPIEQMLMLTPSP